MTELKPKVNESTDSNDMSYKTQDNLQFKFYRKSASKVGFLKFIIFDIVKFNIKNIKYWYLYFKKFKTFLLK